MNPQPGVWVSKKVLWVLALALTATQLRLWWGWRVVSFVWQPGQNVTLWANLTFWKELPLDQQARAKHTVVRHSGSFLPSRNHKSEQPDADELMKAPIMATVSATMTRPPTMCWALPSALSEHGWSHSIPTTALRGEHDFKKDPLLYLIWHSSLDGIAMAKCKITVLITKKHV